MCTPGSDITLDRFMRVAHLLPRQRGNVAVDDYTFANALPWMCRTGARGGRNMVERVFDRVKHYRRAATRHDRLDETFLPTSSSSSSPST